MGRSTEQFAASKLVKPESVVSRLCRTGTYFGVIPRKLENGRLEWPDEPKPTAASIAHGVDQEAAI
jgi:hypothetical protein